MIDLHIHSINSDGDDTVEKIFRFCEEKQLEYIAITDHNNCFAYNSEVYKNKEIFTGKIITGCEFTTSFEGKIIEILGYDIDVDMINEWCLEYYSKENIQKNTSILYNRLINVLDNLGFVYSKEKVFKTTFENEFIDRPIYEELIKYKENYDKLDNKKLLDSLSNFFREGLANPDSPLYINYAEFKPSYEETINLIKRAGGKAFLAHTFEYRFNDNIKFLNDLRKIKELDGIECYHSTFSKEQIDFLIKYAKENNLYISGGSDYHGASRPTRKIGGMNVPNDILKNWIK